MILGKAFPELGTASMALGFLLFNTAVLAVPVFQHALEEGENPSFLIEVLHDVDLTPDERSDLATLKAAANATVRWQALSEETDDRRGEMNLPMLSIGYPAAIGLEKPFWHGPLTKEGVQELLHSPMRERIAELLLERKAVVWVFLESENKSADRSARIALETELKRLKNLFSETAAQPRSGFQDGEHNLSFEILTLSRDDPNERVLSQMLLGTEEDLGDFKDLPILFPIYGRGLVMPALIGAGINNQNVASVVRFLAGPCLNCRLEVGHARVNLLLPVDWSKEVEHLSPMRDEGAFGGLPGN